MDKVNIDVAYKKEKAACVMLVRNNAGKLLYLATTIMACNLAYAANVKALAWASVLAKEAGWRNVIWSMDAKEVVSKV